MNKPDRYLSVFAPSTAQQRQQNFERYWAFTQQHGGDLLEDERDLSNKKAILKSFCDHPVRSREPLPDPERFYRNYVHMHDDPAQLDRKTLLLTCIYKFARHEWVGISGAWDATPTMVGCTQLVDKISRMHLAEEFCHVRLFHEMLRCFHLDRVEWVPLAPWKQKFYELFPRLPGAIMDAPAFVTELMGITFYQHLNVLFDELFADEPELHERLQALLHEIMVDELAHVGQRRNFLGPVATRVSKAMVAPLYRLFFRDIPEVAVLFDVEQMIADGLAFDFNTVPAELTERSWVPSYCLA